KRNSLLQSMACDAGNTRGGGSGQSHRNQSGSDDRLQQRLQDDVDPVASRCPCRGAVTNQQAGGQGRSADDSRMMKPRLIVALLGMTAVVAGCKVGPNFKRPDAPTTDRYTQQELHLDQQIALGASLDREWWHMFQSDAIDTVVK